MCKGCFIAILNKSETILWKTMDNQVWLGTIWYGRSREKWTLYLSVCMFISWILYLLSLAYTCPHIHTMDPHTVHLYLYCSFTLYLVAAWVFVSLVTMSLHVCFTMFVSHFVCAVLSCLVVLACQPITDMIEWAGSGCIQGWLIWGWWPTWSTLHQSFWGFPSITQSDSWFKMLNCDWPRACGVSGFIHFILSGHLNM